VGDFEASALAEVESPVKYHPCILLVLTGTEMCSRFSRFFVANRDHFPVPGPCLVGSLTGAVAS
jgi:hypothetical protein